jgi:DNA-binding NarL/FixJ family response regulator
MPPPLVKLAIADDQILFLKGLKLILDTFENVEIVIEALNGQALLDAMKHVIPDVILMDLKMPELNGLDAMKIIKKDHPKIKVIFLTMYDDERLINHLMKCGANGYLLKNEEPDILQQAINTVMERDYFFNEYVSKALLRGLPSIKGELTAQLDLSIKLSLTRRELEVLGLICKELTTAEIAKKLFISKRTVEGHRKNLMEKTGVRNTAGLVIFAVRNHLVDIMD